MQQTTAKKYSRAYQGLQAANPAFRLETADLDDPAAIAGLQLPPEMDVDQLRALQRLYHVTGDVEAALLLLAAGIHSCFQIAAMAESEFVARYAAAFITTENQTAEQRACSIHSAAAARASTLALIGRLCASADPSADRGNKRGNKPAILRLARDTGAASAAKPAGGGQCTDYATLFGEPAYFDVDPWQSVLSPTAYLADLYWLSSQIERSSTPAALERLAVRRPELPNLLLDQDGSERSRPVPATFRRALEHLALAQPLLAPAAPVTALKAAGSGGGLSLDNTITPYVLDWWQFPFDASLEESAQTRAGQDSTASTAQTPTFATIAGKAGMRPAHAVTLPSKCRLAASQNGWLTLMGWLYLPATLAANGNLLLLANGDGSELLRLQWRQGTLTLRLAPGDADPGNLQYFNAAELPLDSWQPFLWAGNAGTGEFCCRLGQLLPLPGRCASLQTLGIAPVLASATPQSLALRQVAVLRSLRPLAADPLLAALNAACNSPFSLLSEYNSRRLSDLSRILSVRNFAAATLGVEGFAIEGRYYRLQDKDDNEVKSAALLQPARLDGKAGIACRGLVLKDHAAWPVATQGAPFSVCGWLYFRDAWIGEIELLRVAGARQALLRCKCDLDGLWVSFGSDAYYLIGQAAGLSGWVPFALCAMTTPERHLSWEKYSFAFSLGQLRASADLDYRDLNVSDLNDAPNHLAERFVWLAAGGGQIITALRDFYFLRTVDPDGAALSPELLCRTLQQVDGHSSPETRLLDNYNLAALAANDRFEPLLSRYEALPGVQAVTLSPLHTNCLSSCFSSGHVKDALSLTAGLYPGLHPGLHPGMAAAANSALLYFKLTRTTTVTGWLRRKADARPDSAVTLVKQAWSPNTLLTWQDGKLLGENNELGRFDFPLEQWLPLVITLDLASKAITLWLDGKRFFFTSSTLTNNTWHHVGWGDTQLFDWRDFAVVEGDVPHEPLVALMAEPWPAPAAIHDRGPHSALRAVLEMRAVPAEQILDTFVSRLFPDHPGSARLWRQAVAALCAVSPARLADMAPAWQTPQRLRALVDPFYQLSEQGGQLPEPGGQLPESGWLAALRPLASLARHSGLTRSQLLELVALDAGERPAWLSAAEAGDRLRLNEDCSALVGLSLNQLDRLRRMALVASVTGLSLADCDLLLQFDGSSDERAATLPLLCALWRCWRRRLPGLKVDEFCALFGQLRRWRRPGEANACFDRLMNVGDALPRLPRADLNWGADAINAGDEAAQAMLARLAGSFALSAPDLQGLASLVFSTGERQSAPLTAQNLQRLWRLALAQRLFGMPGDCFPGLVGDLFDGIEHASLWRRIDAWDALWARCDGLRGIGVAQAQLLPLLSDRGSLAGRGLGAAGYIKLIRELQAQFVLTPGNDAEELPDSAIEMLTPALAGAFELPNSTMKAVLVQNKAQLQALLAAGLPDPAAGMDLNQKFWLRLELLSRDALVCSLFALTPQQYGFWCRHPLWFNLGAEDAVNILSWTTLVSLGRYRHLVARLAPHDADVLHRILEQAQPAATDADELARWTSALAALYGCTADWLAQLMARLRRFGLAMHDLWSLTTLVDALRALGLQNDAGTTDWLLAALLDSGPTQVQASRALAALVPDQRARARIDAAQETIRREALCYGAMLRLAGKGVAVVGKEGLSRYLLADVQAGAETSLSPVGAAVSALQSHLGMVAARQAGGLTMTDPQRQMFRQMQNWRDFETSRQLYLYPENYLDPLARSGGTELFQRFATQLRSGLSNDKMVRASVEHYLAGLAAFSHMAVLLTDYWQLASANRYRGIVVARSQGADRQFFWREVEWSMPGNFSLIDPMQPVAWGAWHKLALPFSADIVYLLRQSERPGLRRIFAVQLEWQLSVAGSAEPKQKTLSGFSARCHSASLAPDYGVTGAELLYSYQGTVAPDAMLGLDGQATIDVECAKRSIELCFGVEDPANLSYLLPAAFSRQNTGVVYNYHKIAVSHLRQYRASGNGAAGLAVTLNAGSSAVAEGPRDDFTDYRSRNTFLEYGHDTPMFGTALFGFLPNDGRCLLSLPHLDLWLDRYASGGFDALFSPQSQQSLLQLQYRGMGNARFESGIAFDGAYGAYYWELFYYLPWAIARAYRAAGNHKEALRFLRYLFDPGAPDGQLWRVKPLAQPGRVPSLEQLLSAPSALQAHADDPFNPEPVARLRPQVLQKAIFVDYVQSLIEQGDAHYRELNGEALAEAMQCYRSAAAFLGAEPADLGRMPLPPARTLREVATPKAGESLPPVLFKLEQRPIAAIVRPGAAFNFIADAYFGVPFNPALLRLWQTTGLRLYNLRHGLSLDGTVLADSGALVQGAVAPTQSPPWLQFGADGANNGQLPTVPVPAQRFFTLFERAREAAMLALQFGQQVLATLEKQDGEALQQLRNAHEYALTQFAQRMSQARVDELAAVTEALQRQLAGCRARRAHFAGLLQQGMLSEESHLGQVQRVAQVAQTAAQVVRSAAGVAHAFPTIFGLANGGMQPGFAIAAGADVLDAVSAASTHEGTIAFNNAQYRRMTQQWQRGLDEADGELACLDAQLQASRKQQHRVTVEAELVAASLKQNRDVDVWLQSKFSARSLYVRLAGRLSWLHHMVYDLALSLACQAEVVQRFEQPHYQPHYQPQQGGQRFIRGAGWDQGNAGLLSAETLLLQLAQLEKAYRDGQGRGLEIVKTLSLKSLVGAAAWAVFLNSRTLPASLRFRLREAQFDADYPGLWCRRIKSLALTLPGKLDATQNLRALLTLDSSLLTTRAGVAASTLDSGDEVPQGSIRIRPPCAEAAFSFGFADMGLLPGSAADDRFLPFEGAGVHSSWTLTFHGPAAMLGELPDILMEVGYTAIRP